MDTRFVVEITPNYHRGAWRQKIVVVDTLQDRVIDLFKSERVAREVAETMNAAVQQQEVQP